MLTVVAVVVCLPSPSTMFSLSSTTESVDLKVVNAEGAAINLPAAWDEFSKVCLKEIELVPEQNATAKYSRSAAGYLYVSVSGVWSLTSATEASRELHNFSSFLIGDPKNDCPIPEHIRLPATGFVSIGSENVLSPDAETLLTLDNSLVVFGRAVDRFLGLIPLDFGPFKANALYFVESLQIPAGSRISNARGFDGNEVMWWGFVDVVFDGFAHRAMSARLSANAASVDVFAPSPSSSIDVSRESISKSDHIDSAFSQQADTIYLSFGSRLLGDPNLRWIYAIAAALALLVQVISFLWTEIFSRTVGGRH